VRALQREFRREAVSSPIYFWRCVLGKANPIQGITASAMVRTPERGGEVFHRDSYSLPHVKRRGSNDPMQISLPSSPSPSQDRRCSHSLAHQPEEIRDHNRDRNTSMSNDEKNPPLTQSNGNSSAEINLPLQSPADNWDSDSTDRHSRVNYLRGLYSGGYRRQTRHNQHRTDRSRLVSSMVCQGKISRIITMRREISHYICGKDAAR